MCESYIIDSINQMCKLEIINPKYIYEKIIL